MALTTTTTINNGTPGSVTIRVTESGVADVKANIHMISDVKLLTPTGLHPSPGAKVSASTVSWIRYDIARGSTVTLTAEFRPNALASTTVCSRVAVLVSQHKLANAPITASTALVCCA